MPAIKATDATKLGPGTTHPPLKIDVSKLDLSSIDKARASLSTAKVTREDFSPVLTAVHGTSHDKALTLSKALLRRSDKKAEADQDGRALVHWGAAGTAEQRQTVVNAFRQSKLSLPLIHAVGELAKEDAHGYMKEFFATGGGVDEVADWLSIVGGVLRQHQGKAPGTAGSVIKTVEGAANWVKDEAENAVDTVSHAITTVVDAVEAAGKKLGDVITAVATWTAEKLADLAHALVAAGKTVAAILSEALKVSTELVSKFATALVKAGQAVGAMMSWAISSTKAVLKAVAGAVYKAGAKLGAILVAVAKQTLDIVQTTLEGLFAVGVQLVTAVVAICTEVPAAFRKGFFHGLLAIGKAPLEILKAAATAGAATLALAFGIFLEIWGGHRSLTAAEKTEARRVFGWSIDLDRVQVTTDKNLPLDAIEFLNGHAPFTTMYCINFGTTKVDMQTLIHELTHVWQGVVAGPVYMVEALHSQFFGKGYQVTDDDLKKANGDFSKLQREQQAMVVEYYWWGRWGGATSIDWKKYEKLAQAVHSPEPADLAVFDQRIPIVGPVKPALIHLAHPA